MRLIKKFNAEMSESHSRDHVYDLICWAWQAADYSPETKLEFNDCCDFLSDKVSDKTALILARMKEIGNTIFDNPSTLHTYLGEFTELSRVLSPGRSGNPEILDLSDNEYSKMQNEFYEGEAKQWEDSTVDKKDMVVGMFDQHNSWLGYEFMFDRLPMQNEKVILDFACGPGRNIVKYNGRFLRIDGVDISKKNIENAATYAKNNGVKETNLYHCNGHDLSEVPSDTYDAVMSTIAMQHIASHSVRYKYFEEFFRVLKPGGLVTIQMGFGYPSPFTVDYHADHLNAASTNRRCDTEIRSADQVKSDLEKIGYTEFKHVIGPVGPGDGHPSWIYFSAIKPS